MAQINIDVGSSANDGTGTNWRTAWQAVQSMFTEYYDKWVVTGSDIAYTDGNVGVGGPSVGAKLHVKQSTDSATAGLAIRNDGASTGYIWMDGAIMKIQSGGANTGISIETTGRLTFHFAQVYANNAAALVGGLTAGMVYKTASTGDATLMIVNAT